MHVRAGHVNQVYVNSLLASRYCVPYYMRLKQDTCRVFTLTVQLDLLIVKKTRYRMTRWKRGTTEFELKLSYSRNRDGSKSMACRIPKPVLKHLGNPTSLLFVIDEDGVKVTGGNK